jgi:hypothetical protein
MNQELGRTLIVFGAITVLIGVILLFAGRVPLLGKLPGDFVVRKGGFTLYAPIMTGIILSLLLTLALHLFSRRP